MCVQVCLMTYCSTWCIVLYLCIHVGVYLSVQYMNSRSIVLVCMCVCEFEGEVEWKHKARMFHNKLLILSPSLHTRCITLFPSLTFSLVFIHTSCFTLEDTVWVFLAWKNVRNYLLKRLVVPKNPSHSLYSLPLSLLSWLPHRACFPFSLCSHLWYKIFLV